MHFAEFVTTPPTHGLGASMNRPTRSWADTAGRGPVRPVMPILCHSNGEIDGDHSDPLSLAENAGKLSLPVITVALWTTSTSWPRP